MNPRCVQCTQCDLCSDCYNCTQCYGLHGAVDQTGVTMPAHVIIACYRVHCGNKVCYYEGRFIVHQHTVVTVDTPEAWQS